MAEDIAVLGIEARTRGLREAAQELDRLNDSGQRVESSTRGASQSILSLRNALVTIGAGAAARGIITAADNWGQYASRVRMATQSAEEYAIAQSRMLASANRTYRSIEETRESFIQMSPILRDMGLSLNQSIDALDTFSGLLVVNAANAERASQAQNAFSKALQTGRVDAESWQSILRAMPTVVDAIAESTGRTAAEIREMGITGKLAVEDLTDTLLSANEQILRQVDLMPTTVADAMQSLRNEFQEYVGAGNEATGATLVLVDAIETVADNFRSIANVAVVAGAAITGRYVGAIVASTAASVRDVVAKRASLVAEVELARAIQATALAEARAAQTSGARAAALNVAAGAATRAAAAQRGIATTATLARGAMTLLGGPIGIVTTALTLGAAAWLTWGNNAKEALEGTTERAESRLADIEREMQAVQAIIERPGVSDSVRRVQLEKLARLNKEAQALRDVLRETTGGANDLERQNTRLNQYLSERMSLMEQGNAAIAAEVAAFEAATEGLDKSSREYQRAVIAHHRTISELNKKYRDEVSTTKTVVEDYGKTLNAWAQSMRSSAAAQVQEANKATEALESQLDTLGLTGEALAEYRAEKLETTAATAEAEAAELEYAATLLDLQGVLPEVASSYLTLATARREAAAQFSEQANLNRAVAEKQANINAAEAAKDAAQRAADEWRQTADTIEQSLTDALLRAFEDGKGFGEAFRDTLINMFKTLVLRPIIQPIVGGTMGLFGMGSAAASGGAGGAGGSGGIGSLFGGFNPMSFLGGNSIGMGISNIAAYPAQTNLLAGTGIGNSLLGFSGNVAGLSNLGFGLAGLGGGLGANLLFDGKGYSGIGGSLGSTLGFALGGPVGALLGTVGGGFLGSLFGGSGERFPRTVASSRGRYSDGRFEGLGPDPDFFPGDDQFGGSMERALEALQRQFSTRLGGLLEAFDLEADIETTAQTRLRRTSGRLVGALFGTIGDAAFEFRGQFGEDAEIEESFAEFVETALTQGIAEAIRQSSLPENIRNIFAEELSGEQIDAAVDTLTGVADLKGRLESMPAVFGKLSDSIDDVLEAEDFDAFSDAAEQFGELRNSVQAFYDLFTSDADKFRDAQRSLAYEFENLGVSMPRSIDDFRRLADGLDLATDDGRELFNGLMGLAPAFLTVAQAVEQTFDAISASTADTIEKFTLDTLTDRQKYAYYDQQIADTLAELQEAFDPGTISRLYEEANADLQAAWNLLSDAEKQRLRNEFIDRALELEALAQEQLSVTPPDLEPVIEDQARAIGGAVEAAVERVMIRVADSFAASSGDQAAAADALRRAVREINVNVRVTGDGGGEVTYA